VTVRIGAALVVSLVCAVACQPSAPLQKSGALPAGVVATVGSDSIYSESIERIAAAQGVEAPVARDQAVFDALVAAYARERFGPALSRQAKKSASARVLLQNLSRRASDQGPPTDEEVTAATERRFWELDQPALLRTTHAVVVLHKPDDDGRARALAERIHGAVASARDPASFRAAAEAIPKGGLELQVQDLDPVARDGRAIDPAKPPPPGSTVAHFADDYVAAAYAIPEIGMKSPVVRTEFGYHVILAVERIPEQRTPLEERRRLLAPEILAARAEKLRDEILGSALKTTTIEVERAAMDLTERVKALQ
jgi:parvulin-like peptidyl-prolyl isomerase